MGGGNAATYKKGAREKQEQSGPNQLEKVGPHVDMHTSGSGNLAPSA